MKDPSDWIGGIGGWPDFNVEEDHCPACGERFDGMANTNGMDGPGPGDVAACIWCFTLNTVGDDGKLRLATDGEAMAYAHDPDLQRIVWAMRQLGPPPRRTP
jgi:hypothetical protein